MIIYIHIYVVLLCTVIWVQVSIAGSLLQVERARQSIRELSPIFLWIELLLSQGMSVADHSAAVEDIMTTYNVNVQFKPVSVSDILLFLCYGRLLTKTESETDHANMYLLIYSMYVSVHIDFPGRLVFQFGKLFHLSVLKSCVYVQYVLLLVTNYWNFVNLHICRVYIKEYYNDTRYYSAIYM